MTDLKFQKGISVPTTIFAVVLIIVATVVIYYVIKPTPAGEPFQETQPESSQETQAPDTETDLPPASGRLDELDGGSGDIEENAVLTMLLNNEATAVAFLEDVDGSGSSGSAYRLVQDGKLYHAVVATMPNPQSGNSYEGWLVQSTPLKFFSTGVMTSPEQGVWVLEYTADNEYPTYLKVVITEETSIDATPERHVIEGSF